MCNADKRHSAPAAAARTVRSGGYDATVVRSVYPETKIVQASRRNKSGKDFMRRFRSSRRAAGNTKQPRDPESGTPEIFARAGFGRSPRPYDRECPEPARGSLLFVLCCCGRPRADERDRFGEFRHEFVEIFLVEEIYPY